MFLDNKYTKWYYNIVNSAKGVYRLGDLEKHHIIPVLFGGQGGPVNVVRLTAREHYICHQLLVKMTHGVEQNAFREYLNSFNCETSKQYQAQKILSTFKFSNNPLNIDTSQYTKEQWAKLNRILVNKIAF